MLEVITGCMYSGKTTRFIQRVEKLEEEGKTVFRLKPMQDFRYSKNDIVTHDGVKIKGIAIDEVDEIHEILSEEEYDVIAIDEVQFFHWDFIEIINELADSGKHVLLAGVDLDFSGSPFGIMPEILAYADVLIKLNAKCSVCQENASRSQRLVNGKPARKKDPRIIYSDEITYEPRCRKHHELRD